MASPCNVRGALVGLNTVLDDLALNGMMTLVCSDVRVKKWACSPQSAFPLGNAIFHGEDLSAGVSWEKVFLRLPELHRRYDSNDRALLPLRVTG